MGATSGLRVAREDMRESLRRTVPALDITQQRVAVALAALLTEGEPVREERVADALGLSRGAVRDAVGGLRTVVRDERGNVTGCCGLTLSATPHRLAVERTAGARLHTWCAWDALLLCGILGRPIRSTSRCAVTGEPIEVDARPDGTYAARPPATVMSFVMPDLAARSIFETFCRFVRFFSSAAACREWLPQDYDVLVLSLGEACDLARTVNGACFPVMAGRGADGR